MPVPVLRPLAPPFSRRLGAISLSVLVRQTPAIEGLLSPQERGRLLCFGRQAELCQESQAIKAHPMPDDFSARALVDDNARLSDFPARWGPAHQHPLMSGIDGHPRGHFVAFGNQVFGSDLVTRKGSFYHWRNHLA